MEKIKDELNQIKWMIFIFFMYTIFLQLINN